MVDLEVHCFPPATTLGGGGATWITLSSDSGTLQWFFQVPLYGPHVKSP